MVRTIWTLILFIWVNGATAGFAQTLNVNGAVRHQTIRGLGVNINPQSWNGNADAVKRVIDELIGMGSTSFRLMFDDCDWEVTNDNDDFNSYNWAYYDTVYSEPRFMCVWNTIRYLNSKGITDITLSPDGAAPAWMGGTKLELGKEAEYAEMMSSMVFYGKKRLNPPVQFSMLSPVNETTCGGSEAAVMYPNQFGSLFAALAAHLTTDNIRDVTLIGPDDCNGWAANLQAMMANKDTMAHVRYFGQHEYGNSVRKATGMVDDVRNSAYSDREVIMTEINAVCKGCDDGTYNADYGFNNYAGPAFRYILNHLNVGVTGIQVWEGYDSQYHHPKRSLTWSTWGIFGVNDIKHPDVYTKRPHYYALEQLFKFVKSGFQRIDAAASPSDMTVSAFYDQATGMVVITGVNDGAAAVKLNGTLQNLPAVSSLQYFFTDASHNFARGSDTPVARGAFSQSLPPKCAFTLVSNPGRPAPKSK